MPHHKQMLLLFFIAGFLPPGQAETLQEAWKLAIENNHQIKSAQAQTYAFEQQLFSTQGQRLPELNVSGGYTQLSEIPTAQTQIDGQSAQFPINQSGSGNAQAIVSLPIFTSGRISHQISAAEASLQAAQQNELTTLQTIKMQVAQAYIAVLRAESALKVAQSHVDSLAAHAQDVNNLYTQGMVARNDVLFANVELANARQRTVQANNRLDIVRSNYNQLLDKPLSRTVTLVAEFPKMPAEDLTTLSNLALKHRSELAVLSQQIKSLEQQAISAKAGLLPQLAVNGGYQFQENRYQVFEGMWMVNVGMQWKLFDGSTRHNSDAITRQATALKEQRDNLRSQITLQVRRAWLDVEETRKRIEVTQSAIAQAEENLKVTIDRYQQGLSTQTDVLKAEDLRTTTHDNFNNAHYDHSLAILRLQRSIGAFSATTITAFSDRKQQHQQDES